MSDLRVWVHLGCRDEEKYHPQRVSFNIELTFKYPPKGLLTDKLDDTVCYLACVQKIDALCQSRSFGLIEHLTLQVYEGILLALGDKRKNISQINVTMCKMSAPIPGVHGGVSFTYCASPSRRSKQ
ncbi:MAG: dihydroneopterin aldolase [Alphaproteobacteria bacterium 16-39-46]|nr:MAG: dihydroneopterin aldolase [Alphaproteobacteria bacterium 16-39-46]OZA44016.1 MAG: dihydroneopterin aldolase [Alphaproteobacteria bacterium 17-39-52]HQS84188.1 dihydroneopterin aldolase [Alphaproteobacteria bacterium]HQS93441.1 dihydroneopterin aldolase [Alphaproteobacteria bacterium]